MNISLTPELQEVVRRLAESGRYGSENETLIAAVKLLDGHDRKLEALRRDIQEGIESGDRGELLDLEDVIAELRRDHEEPFGPRQWRG